MPTSSSPATSSSSTPFAGCWSTRCAGSQRSALALGAVLPAVGSAISVASGLSFPYWPEGERAAFIADAWQPPPAMIDAELAASPLWFRSFRFGPAEWAWRWLTCGERPPLRRTPAPEPSE